MAKSACDYQRSVKRRTWWAEPGAAGSVRNQGAVFFNKPSSPQTQAGLLVVSAGQTVWCGTFPPICCIFSPRFSLFSCCISLFLSMSLHPTSLVKQHTWKQWGGRWAKRDGFTAKENLKSQTRRPFCFGNVWVNCNAFTAAIALNGPCIMGHHYSEETHRTWVIADCSPAPGEVDEG